MLLLLLSLLIRRHLMDLRVHFNEKMTTHIHTLDTILIAIDVCFYTHVRRIIYTVFA